MKFSEKIVFERSLQKNCNEKIVIKNIVNFHEKSFAYRLAGVWPPAGRDWCFLVTHLIQISYGRPTFDRKEWYEKLLQKQWRIYRN